MNYKGGPNLNLWCDKHDESQIYLSNGIRFIIVGSSIVASLNLADSSVVLLVCILGNTSLSSIFSSTSTIDSNLEVACF